MAPDPGDGIRDDDTPDGPENPLAALFAQLGLPLPKSGEEVDLRAMVSRLQSLMGAQAGTMSSPSGGVNWTFAKDTARKVVASLGPDPTPSARDQREVADAVRLADMWLNDHTVFPAVAAPPVAWSRAEWIENTMGSWQQMVEPIVANIARSLGSVVGERMSDEPTLAGIQAMFQPMLQQAASSMFGMQLGQAIGKLGTEVLSATDVGLPLTGRAQVALLPTNLAAFGEGLDIEDGDVLLYQALREAARQRLFDDTPWVGPQLTALVQHYAREITIDASALESSFENVSGGELSLEALNNLGLEVGSKLFEPAKTPVQMEILERLETLLALVEGWVDDVVGQAARQWMPSSVVLSETVRRRRAAGGPAERTFAALVGLELRPRRLRDAANLWAALREARGVEGRDAVWSHPDAVPTSAHLDDPLGFVQGDSMMSMPDDMDAELAKLLDAEGGEGG